MQNALTIDLEDWFQVSNLDDVMPREQWPDCEFRLAHNTDRLLQMLRENNTKATFFVLGWNARRYPWIVRAIADEGHEIATHGYSHRLVYEMTRAEFQEDLRRSIASIEDAAGVRVRAHRAASFSITEASIWALEVLVSEGITCDSSMFPIKHDRYGVNSQWAEASDIVTPSGSIREVPITTWQVGGMNLPFSGGGYFRLLPYWLVRRITRSINSQDKPVIFYFHPWEIDAGIPRFDLGRMKSFRSYHNLESNAAKLSALLRDFQFSTLSHVIGQDRPIIRTLQHISKEDWMLV